MMSDDTIGRPKLQMLTVDPAAIRSAASSGARSSTDASTGSGPTAYTDAFDAVFRREYAPVARMAYLLLGATGEAEEVTQEAFTTLLQRWDSIDNPAGFVRTAVLNRSRDLGRRRSVRRRALQRLRPTSEVTIPDRSADLEVVDALASLDRTLRETVVLRYYLDHTIDQIAEMTNVPAGTVKSRLNRARAALAALFTDD